MCHHITIPSSFCWETFTCKYSLPTALLQLLLQQSFFLSHAIICLLETPYSHIPKPFEKSSIIPFYPILSISFSIASFHDENTSGLHPFEFDSARSLSLLICSHCSYFIRSCPLLSVPPKYFSPFYASTYPTSFSLWICFSQDDVEFLKLHSSIFSSRTKNNRFLGKTWSFNSTWSLHGVLCNFFLGSYVTSVTQRSI